MTTTNKKPGAFRQPGKVKTPAKPTRITAAQREVHDRIAAQSEHSQVHPRLWHPEEYPDLYRLIESAKRAARSRRRLRGRIVFRHECRSYAARFTGLDRIIVEDQMTGRFIASSGFFAL
jgi:hypothetical protein